MSEALEPTLSDPDLMLALLERTTRLLVGHARAFRDTGASGVIVAAILDAQVEVCHFGAPMDIASALDRVGGAVILCGNLDATAVCHGGTPIANLERFHETVRR